MISVDLPSATSRLAFRLRAVLSYLLVVAAVNLAVGYGLAVALGHARPRGATMPVGSRAAAEAIRPSDSVKPPAATQHVAPLPLDGLPAPWQAALAEAGEVRSLVEGSAHFLGAEAGRYRQRLVKLDGQLRRCRREPRRELLILCLGEIQQANEDWLRTQNEARSVLRARRSQGGELAAVGASLEELLTEQAAQIKGVSTQLAALDTVSDAAAGAARLLDEVGKLLDLCHRLRDRMQDALVTILQGDDRLPALDDDRLVDRGTGIHNRLGLERALAQWSADPESAGRTASFALVDIDRLGQINERHGPLVGDRVISQVARLANETVRRDRGFDVVARLAGQIVAVFLGDTTPQSAAAALERVRQTIQAQRFMLGDDEVEVRVSCGVIEATLGDTSSALCYRVAQTLREAKRAGRNLTLVQTAAGVVVTEPTPCHVAGGTIRLNEEIEQAERRQSTTGNRP